jgi:tetratricopeptide (TPR) repeat protein
MTRMKLFVGGTAAVLVVAVVFLGGALAGSPPSSAAGSRAGLASDRLLSGLPQSDTGIQTASLERRVAARPQDVEALTLLGLAYQQRARETGDPSFYLRSERVLRRALRIEPTNSLTLRGLASLAASRHRFDESLKLARRAQRQAPRSAAVYGLLGDAYLELGRYERAFAAFDRMASLKPGPLAYARISYARELLGETEAALEAMMMAVSSAGRSGEPAAWASAQLGNLYLGSGRLRAASESHRRALNLFPGYAPALAGLGRTEWWRGRLPSAAQLFRLALERAPVPDYAVALGDVYAQMGRSGEAEQAYEQAEMLERAFVTNGGRNQLEIALFNLDHDREVAAALSQARIGQRLRPSIEGEHVLAWALYKNGHCAEAKKRSIRALRLGTKDTGALLHRSFIEACLGNDAAAREFRARALDANPYALMTVGSPRIHRRS